MLASRATFLDSNAGAPLASRVAEALLPLLTANGSAGTAAPGNPSSQHTAGRKARFALQRARDQVASSLGVTSSNEILFTSCGTESIQLALKSVLEPALWAGRRPHLITSRVEHEATLQLARWLVDRGGFVSYAEVDSQGRVQSGALTAALKSRPDVAANDTIVSLIWVNNETGVIQDLESIASEARSLGLPLHLDGAQAWGKLPIRAQELGADWLSLSAHKIGGLAGTGVLWTRRPIPAVGILGKQEADRRGGTENLLGIVAAGAAASDLSLEKIQARQAEWTQARDRLQARLLDQVPGVRINGGDAPRVGNTLNFSIQGIDRPGLVAALDLDGFAVSSGSACSSGVTHASHVLMALGRSDGQARSSVRVSMADPMRDDEIEAFVGSVRRSAARMQA